MFSNNFYVVPSVVCPRYETVEFLDQRVDGILYFVHLEFSMKVCKNKMNFYFNGQKTFGFCVELSSAEQI